MQHTLEALRASPPETPKQAKGKASPGKRKTEPAEAPAEPGQGEDQHEDAEQDKLGSGCETDAQVTFCLNAI